MTKPKATPKQPAASSNIGTTAYRNWKLSNQAPPYAYEVPLYSDVPLAGLDRENLGPYKIYNAFSSTNYQPEALPRLHLVIESYLNETHVASLDTADHSRYHGGDLADEIAALLSLSNGIRLKAGNVVRTFSSSEGPYGQPHTPHPQNLPSIPSGKRHRGFASGERLPSVIPNITTARSIDTGLLRDYLRLEPSATVALARSARFYQEAVWIADAAPELAWLMLTSAVETAAQYWHISNRNEIPGLTDIELLKSIFPGIVKDLSSEPNADALMDKIAGRLSEFIGATRKFCGFVLSFCPSPPPHRPTAPHLRIDWSQDGIRDAMKRIYGHRSNALHGGMPFPPLMCERPYAYKDDAREVISERSLGQGVATVDGSWTAEDSPMVLNTFEYITRSVLIAWWRSLIPYVPETTSISGCAIAPPSSVECEKPAVSPQAEGPRSEPNSAQPVSAPTTLTPERSITPASGAEGPGSAPSSAQPVSAPTALAPEPSITPASGNDTAE